MTTKISSINVALRIWLFTSVLLSLVWLIYCLTDNTSIPLVSVLAILALSLVTSSPIIIVLNFSLPKVDRKFSTTNEKLQRLITICIISSVPYSIPLGLLIAFTISSAPSQPFPYYVLAAIAILIICACVSILINHTSIHQYFSLHQNHLNIMEHQQQEGNTGYQTNEPAANWRANNPEPNNSNKTFIKALITGGLILAMLIPMLFISSLVTEREERQKQVVQEVSSKWSDAQTLSGPYLHIPYTVKETDDKGKETITTKKIIVLPENLDINGTMNPEIRPRSIYKVYLYKSNIKATGNFIIKLPKEIDPNSLQLNEAKICFNLSDFKGIEEKLSINLNNINYELSPGLPFKEFQKQAIENYTAASFDRVVTTQLRDVEMKGLSAPINIQLTDFDKPLQFNMEAKINGSEKLNFIPLAGNSTYTLQSTWADPKFDGTKVPNQRNVSPQGFTAKWNFNKANLPFYTILNNFDFKDENFSFGVSMLQPADQYSKTMRSVKYAILFIGLTFALFFIIEIMQKKPVHPVQYILVGIALVVFYTLLLSISEFIMFDYAYLIASTAIVLLITLYSKAHFKSIKTASLFGLVLAGLYGFIFVLIRLEDTALLVGSIGLFIVLALIMYASRKVNWYNK